MPTTKLRAHLDGLRARGETAMGLFLTAGFPSPAATLDVLEAADRGGADFVELGMPFSDPVAEGLPIQQASERALRQGATMAGTFETAAAFRKSSDTPLVLMGYANPVFRYGVGDFCADAASSGVDGLILPDLPPEEAHDLEDAAAAHRLSVTHLIAPNTSQERVRLVDARSTGFVYAVSVTGLTGSGLGAQDATDAYLERARAVVEQPLLVGFGISTHADAARLTTAHRRVHRRERADPPGRAALGRPGPHRFPTPPGHRGLGSDVERQRPRRPMNKLLLIPASLLALGLGRLRDRRGRAAPSARRDRRDRRRDRQRDLGRARRRRDPRRARAPDRDAPEQPGRLPAPPAGADRAGLPVAQDGPEHHLRRRRRRAGRDRRLYPLARRRQQPRRRPLGRRSAAVNLRPDLWADDQLVTIATAATDSALAVQFLERGPELRERYEDLARVRTGNEIYARLRQTDLEDELLREHGFRVGIQHDYVPVQDTSATAAGLEGEFVRYRRVLVDTWRDFFVFYADGVETLPSEAELDAVTNDLLETFARGVLDSSYVQLDDQRPETTDAADGRRPAGPGDSAGSGT